MKTERILLSLLAVVIGLIVAGIAFFLYENTRKNKPQSQTKEISVVTPTPTTSKPSIFLSLDKPKDEEVVTKKIISISGKTVTDAIVVVLTNNDEEVLAPTSNGDFSTTTTIEDGENLIEITAIKPDGESTSILRVVTFSKEEF